MLSHPNAQEVAQHKATYQTNNNIYVHLSPFNAVNLALAIAKSA
jgi:hypothetical protein